MRIGVVGGGGREHAIIKAIRKNPSVEKLYAIPGNGGIARDAECVPEIKATDVEGLDQETFDKAVQLVLSEPQLDDVSAELPKQDGAYVFAVEFLPGQFDQRADSAAQCIQILTQGERPKVRSAKVYLLYGDLSADEIA